MLEAHLEAYFRKRVRLALGGVVVKLAPTLAGIPDRLVILPEGQIFLVELKTDMGALSPVQTVWHSKVRALGSPVYVLFGKDEIDRWVRSQANRPTLHIDEEIPPEEQEHTNEELPVCPDCGFTMTSGICGICA